MPDNGAGSALGKRFAEKWWEAAPIAGPDGKPPPKPPPDYSHAPWGKVAGQFLTNYIPSATTDIPALIKSIPGMVGAVTNPSNPSLAHALSPADPRFAGAPPIGSEAAVAQSPVGQLVGNVASGYGQRFGSVERAKQTLATDPFGATMDIAAAAAPVEGALRTASRIPGVIGDASRIGAGVAGAAGTATNPLRAAGEATAGASAAGQRLLRQRFLDPTGNFNQAARNAVSAAFPNGEITEADLANPQFRQALTQTFTAKGVSPQAVREAVLSYAGVPTLRAPIMGQKAPEVTRSPVSDAIVEGRKAIGQRIQQISGAPQPDPSALGAALENAHAKSAAAAGARFDALREAPGSFGPSVDAERLNGNIGANLQALKLPSNPDLLERSAKSYPQAKEAWDLVNDALVNGNTRLGGEVDAPELMEIRRQLTQLQNGAKGTDKLATGAVIDGFHQTIGDMANAGEFRTPTGGANMDFAQALNDANAAYRAHKVLYGTKPIASAVNALQDSAEAGVSGVEPQMAVQKGLARSLADKAQGPATYQLLNTALDGDPALDNHVRQSVLALDPSGYAANTDTWRNFLNGSNPLRDVFNPQEQSEIRLLGAADDMLSGTKIGGQEALGTTGRIAQFARRGAGALAGAGAGALVSPLIPHADTGILTPLLHMAPEVVGAAGGSLMEKLIDPTLSGDPMARQLRGAPTPGAALDFPRNVGETTARVSPALPIATVAGREGQSQPQTPAASPPSPAPLDINTWEDPTASPAAAPAPTPGKPWYADAPVYVAPKERGRDEQPAPDTNAINIGDWPDPTTQQADGGRITRASGGKVTDIEPLVQRLMSKVKEARNAEKRATKPLLGAPDSAVATALDIAQRAI